MATFLMFNDKRVNHFLLAELDGKDVERLHSAVKLSAKSSDPEIIGKLAHLLNARLPVEHEKNLKTAIINSLAEAGNKAALPALRKFLFTRQMLQAGKMTQLKIAVLHSLVRYNDPASLALAEEIARSSAGDLGMAAARVVLQMKSQSIK
jgi:hypothetical protein